MVPTSYSLLFHFSLSLFTIFSTFIAPNFLAIMIDFSNATIRSLAVHWVGNKSKEENLVISNELYHVDAQLEKVLLSYFIKPFRGKDEFQQFQHHAELSMNEMYSFCKSVFQDPNSLYLRSVNILQHLYDQSTHAKVKSGEVYVAHLDGCLFGNQPADVVGIFKSEDKETFLKFKENTSQLEMNIEKGINIKKLDKGCLVFNVAEESGYRVLSMDRSNYDAIYWMEDFLNIAAAHEENFQTQNCIALCRDFSQHVVAAEEDTTGEVMFMKKSVEYFAKNDEFEMDHFMGEVVQDSEYKSKFKEFKDTFEEDHSFSFEDNFAISKPAVRTMQKYIKNLIRLDTNMEIKLNFNDPESANRFIEKGYDEQKEMYYYKVYFNEEID
jgi:hypothetical protein